MINQFEVPKNLEVRFVSDEIGYGVFTTAPIGEGDIIEICYCIECSAHVDDLVDYLYRHDETKKSLLAFGFGSIYNHNYSNNIHWRTIDGNDNFIQLYAKRDIEAGEELCHDYGVGYWKRKEKKLI